MSVCVLQTALSAPAEKLQVISGGFHEVPANGDKCNIMCQNSQMYDEVYKVDSLLRIDITFRSYQELNSQYTDFYVTITYTMDFFTTFVHPLLTYFGQCHVC